PWNLNNKSFYMEAFGAIPSMFRDTAEILKLPTLIVFSTLVVVMLLARGKVSFSFCVQVIIGLTIVDLLYHGRTDPPVYFTSPEFFEPKGIESLDFLQKNTETARVLEIQKLKPFPETPLTSYSMLDEYYTRGVRFFDFNSFVFVARPDSLLHYSIPSASGYLGFYPSRYYKLHHGRPNDILHFVKPEESVDTLIDGWVDMQAIRYILTVPGTVSQRYAVAYSSGDLTIFENRNAVPLVYPSGNTKVIKNPEEVFEYIHSDQFNPNQETVLEQDPGKVISSKASLIIAQKRSASLLVAVLSEFDSLVVFAENYYPGWRAFVDGKQVPIYRANYTFQAVKVPAGKHTVKFSFEVVYFRLAVALTAIGLLIWFMFFVKLA
ncbi:MAG TPA: YfhO family protein, partial [Acidobacteriota bacterium]|nr:YfhO family protein [Acidobacteriota bacterium]